MASDFFKNRSPQFIVGLTLGASGGVLGTLIASIIGRSEQLGSLAIAAGYAGFSLFAIFAPTGRAAVVRLLIAGGLIMMSFPYVLYLGPQDNLAIAFVAYPGFFLGIVFILLGFIVRGPRNRASR